MIIIKGEKRPENNINKPEKYMVKFISKEYIHGIE